MKYPVREVTITVTAAARDVADVMQSMQEWFSENDISLACSNGAVHSSTAFKCPEWAKHTLYPESMEEEEKQ
jgi:hypothetical protein